jgi:ABC-type transport system substrate-binding protein
MNIVLRTKLSIPAVAVVLLSGTLGSAQLGAPAHARATAAGYSGTIVITDDVFPDSLPFGGAYGSSSTDAEVAGPLTDQLLGTDNHGQFFADLATAVPTSANGGIKVVGGNEVVTLHLKPNLKWSDGTPITPQDFIASVVFDLAPEVNNIYGVDQIRSINVSGGTMTITYKGIYAPALFSVLPTVLPFEHFNKKYHTNVPAGLLASYDAGKVASMFAGSSYRGSQLQKMVDAWLADSYTSPADVFDGPYKLSEWSTDQRVTEVPNPYYSALPADARHPRPAQIQFVIVTENPASYAMQMSAASTYNNIDLAEDFRPADLPQLQKSKYQVVVRPQLAFAHLELNQQNPALRDARVRQALQYAIDKPLYIQSLFGSLSPALVKQLSLTSFLPSTSSWSNNASLPANPYNPSRAMALLASAGYATSLGGSGKHLTLTFTCAASPTNLRSAQLLQAFWSRIGIAIKLVFPPPSGPNGELSSYQDGGILYRRHFDIVQFGFTVNLDPDQFSTYIDPAQIPDASHPLGHNYSGINDPVLLNLFHQARQSLDTAQRHKYYDQAQTRFYNQAYWIMLWDNPNISAYKGTIGNFKPNPTQAQNEWNAAEWYRTTGASPQ